MFEFNFDKKLNDFLKILVTRAANAGFNIYIVGGAVRDVILNNSIKDIDLIVEGNAIEFSKLLPAEISTLSVHEDFCTVKVEYLGLKFDIASTRTEIYPNSGCLPVVKEIGVKLADDVKRRDFTVNTLYLRLYIVDNELKFELIDLCCAIDDIKSKKLKVLHDNSYIDDPTRILRGLGLKYRFGFDFTEHDKKLISEYFSNIDYSNMSIDRCKSVFEDTLKINPQEIFDNIVKCGYYKIIQPNIINFDINKIKFCIESFGLNNNEQAKFLLGVIVNLNIDLCILNTNIEILNCFNKIKTPDILAYYYYKTADNNVLKYLELRSIKIFISGENLIQAGYKQGKAFSDIFNSIYEYKLSNPDKLHSKTDELKFVKTLFPLN